jgi:hypothetical protein
MPAQYVQTKNAVVKVKEVNGKVEIQVYSKTPSIYLNDELITKTKLTAEDVPLRYKAFVSKLEKDANTSIQRDKNTKTLIVHTYIEGVQTRIYFKGKYEPVHIQILYEQNSEIEKKAKKAQEAFSSFMKVSYGLSFSKEPMSWIDLFIEPENWDDTKIMKALKKIV